MPQRKLGWRWGQGCPAGLLIAKSADAEKAGATQHSAQQLSQSARRLRLASCLMTETLMAVGGWLTGRRCAPMNS